MRVSLSKVLEYYKDVLNQAQTLNRITEEEFKEFPLKFEVRHQFEVCNYVAECVRDKFKVLYLAALNHNLIEKGLRRYSEIYQECGKDVADLVAGVTDFRYTDRRGRPLREWIPNRGLKELPWRVRKEETLRRLKRGSYEMQFLMLCIACDDLRIITMQGCRKFGADFKSLKWYYGELLKLFRDNPQIRCCSQYRCFYQQKYHKLFG